MRRRHSQRVRSPESEAIVLVNGDERAVDALAGIMNTAPAPLSRPAFAIN